MRLESIEHIGRTGHDLYGFLTPDVWENFKRYLDAEHHAGHEHTGANFMVIVSLIIAPTDAEAQRLQQRALDVAWDAVVRRNLPLEEAEFHHPAFGGAIVVFGGAIVGSPQTVLGLAPALETSGSRRLDLVMRPFVGCGRGPTDEAPVRHRADAIVAPPVGGRRLSVGRHARRRPARAQPV